MNCNCNSDKYVMAKEIMTTKAVVRNYDTMIETMAAGTILKNTHQYNRICSNKANKGANL